MKKIAIFIGSHPFKTFEEVKKECSEAFSKGYKTYEEFTYFLDLKYSK